MLQAQATGIRTGWSTQPDPHQAVRELAQSLRQPDLRLVVFHCAPHYDRAALTQALHEEFGDTQVIGCTTAGEISPDGYRDDTIVGFSLAGPDFVAEVIRIDNLADFSLTQGESVGRDLRAALQTRGVTVAGNNTFGLLLIDGLSVREENVASSLYQSLGDIEMIGGSAADGTDFGSTWVYHDGAFHTDAAVFTLVHTAREFVVLQTQHFDADQDRMVVTAADTEHRIVTEINGVPAGREYARMVGLGPEELTPMIFASHPVVVRVSGKPFVRSIQKVNDDESLTFFCSIDEGIVLTVARGVDMQQRLRETFEDVRTRIGHPELVIGCDCILRYLEMQQTEIVNDMSELLREYNVVGFSTYGEQYNGMHVNQTFTGVALGAARRADG